MAKRRAQSQRNTGGRRPKSAGGVGGVVLAFLIGGVAATGAGYLYLHSHDRAEPVRAPRPAALQRPPAPSGPGALPAARPDTTAAPALQATTVGAPPFGASEDVFEAGARVYSARCASCHGLPARDASSSAVHAPQIFGEASHRIAAEPPAQLYRAIAVGAPGKGMPAYGRSLSETALWQVTLLLGSADQPLPDPVTAILRHPKEPHPR